MAEVKSAAKPPAAALVTGFDTPEGQSVAAGLARAGYRVCVVHAASSAALSVSQLPGHERLQHQAIVAELADAVAAGAVALEAQRRLGHVTALVHVAFPSAADANEDGFDAASFARELQLGAGAFLALALGLLPGMLATQTGCLSVLSEAPLEGASFANARVGAGAALGALLGAVRQVADRTEGTELRSIALLTDAGPRVALSNSALATLGAQLGFDPTPGLLESGGFLRLSTKAKGAIAFLRPPSAAASLPQAQPATRPAQPAPAQNDRVGQTLAQTFRSAFGLAAGVDVSNLAVGSVKRWDSLGHLKLMMEVEQALRVRLPADALARIQSYRDLEKAVRAYLPAS